MRATITALVAAVCLACGSVRAEELRLEAAGETITYELHRLAPAPALADPAATLTDPAAIGDGALDTARRIAKHLAAGEIEEAALLSNAPKRRYEVLADYRDSVGPEEFKRVFGEYADPRNPVIAEIAIGPRRALVWRLGPEGALAAQYYVEVDGRFLLDDVPSDERARLRRVFEAYRAGTAELR